MNLTQSSPVQLFWVPCTYDSKTSTFSPIYSLATYPLPPASHSAGGAPTDTSWAEAEDEQLRVLVRELGLKQWIKIAIALNQEFHQSTAVRRGKQCRERWYDHLDPNKTKHTRRGRVESRRRRRSPPATSQKRQEVGQNREVPLWPHRKRSQEPLQQSASQGPNATQFTHGLGRPCARLALGLSRSVCFELAPLH